MTKSSFASFVFTFITLASSPAFAQQSMTLDEATARALERNHAIRIERLKLSASEADMEQAQGAYDPQLRIDVSARHHSDPINTLFSGAPEGEVASSNNELSSEVSLTRLFKTGAVASVFAAAGRETTNSLFTLLSPAYTSSLGVELRQPLSQRRAIDPARMALRVTALDRDRSSARLDRQVMDTIAEVEKAYWALVAARREVDVRRVSVRLAERQRDDTQVRIEAKTIAASDLAQPMAEIERRRGELLRAEELVARAERTLKTLILDGPADALWSTQIQPTDTPDTVRRAVDVERALADAGASRPELAEIAAEIERNEVHVTAARDALKPTVDVFVSYVARGLGGDASDDALAVPGFISTVPSALNGGIGTSWRNLAEQRFNDIAAGVTIAIPLGRHAAKGQLGAALADRREAATRLEQTHTRIAAEVRNAITAVDTAAGRIDAATAGLSAAETQLRAEQDRFSAGVGTNFFVLTRQSELATAQLTQIAAIADYRIALAELGRATGTLLRDRNIDVNR